MSERVRVCFVCLGNICRSPTAEGVFIALVARAGLSASIAVDSAGTANYHVGDAPDPRTLSAAKRRGYPLPSVGRQFERRDFARFDYVIAMDRNNLRDLVQLAGPGGHAHLRLLRSFEDPPHADVPDPYYGGPGGFEEVLDICERACAGLLAEICATHGFTASLP